MSTPPLHPTSGDAGAVPSRRLPWRRELARQLLHLAVGGLVLALPWIGTRGLATVCGALVVWTAWIFPRLGGRRLWRPREAVRGGSRAMVLYPAALGLVLLVWWDRPEVAAGAWLLLAVGDAAATLFGRGVGGPLLPWNRRATVAGVLGFVLAATPALAGVWWWLARRDVVAVDSPWIAASVVAVVVALLESLPLAIDDNVTVSVGGALVLDGVLRSVANGPDLGGLLAAAGLGFVVNVVFATLLVWLVGATDRRGAIAGCVLGTILWAGLGLGGWLLLVVFVGLGVGTTRVGWSRKREEGTTESPSGRRGVRNVLANVSIASGAGLLAATTGEPAYVLAAAGALAAALADTLSSELGQASGHRPLHLRTLRRVAPGTDGAVTGIGTLASVAGAVVVAAVATSAGLVDPPGGLRVAAAGVAGSFVDSLLGATLEGEGGLDNEAVNLLATLSGAVFAATLP